MANAVEFCSVVHNIVCLWGQFCAPELYQTSNDNRSVYRFHVYYHVRQVLKRLQTPLPNKTGFNVADNPYTESEFLKICEDYGVPNDPMRYRDKKFYWTYQRVFIG